MRSSVGAKRRKFWLMAATALASSSLGVSEPALAQCNTVGSTTTCTPGGNPYSTGINVDGTATPSLPLSLFLQPSGVQVVIPAGPGGVNAVNAANSTGVTLGSGDITITADGVTIDNAANVAITTPGCEYSPAAPPSLMQRTPQLMWLAPRATGRYWRSHIQTGPSCLMT
jgi:hypothetical protein